MKPAEAEAVPQLSIDPFDKAFLANPYAYHDIIREAGPVVWLESVNAFAMARYEEVRDLSLIHI